MANNSNLFSEALSTACETALAYLQGLDSASVAPTAVLADLRHRLAKGLPDYGLSPKQVLLELARDVHGGIVGSAGPRFFGWVIGGSLPAALAADWLAATWDQNAVLYAAGPAAAVVEEAVGAWLKEILGLPQTASFALVSGCQMAHLTCLAAARHSLLRQRGYHVESLGLSGSPRIRILATGYRHGSVERAARLLGFGSSQIVNLATDDAGRLRPEALEQALADSPDAPTIVVLQAGEINTGACDPFAAAIPMAKQRRAWVHIDGAFGLWAGASPNYKHLVQGVEKADSWATDGHKWLNVPFDCGYAFVAHPEAHRAAVSHRASYLTHDAEARDPIDWNPEWSRRARGFSTYAALRQLGRNGVADLVERCCRHACALVTRIGELPGAEIVHQPTLNQGLLRFLDPRTNAVSFDHDAYTDQAIREILATGEAFFTGSDWRGRRVMRVSVCNWQTSDEDVDRAVAAVSAVLKQEHSAHSLKSLGAGI